MTDNNLPQQLGISEQHFREITQILSQYLTQASKVNAFGSRTKGTYKPFSDLDLCITGKSLNYATLSKITEAFSESNIPFFVEITQELELSKKFRRTIQTDFIEIPL